MYGLPCASKNQIRQARIKGTISPIMPTRSNLIYAILLVVVIAVVTTFGPSERSLGVNVRLVYLHGAWVWTSLIALGLAAIVGFLGLGFRQREFNRWSLTTGRVGMIFWLTYIPLSMWTMQANWNGLYLAEPRFKVAVDFAVTGVLLQIALTLLRDERWASILNIAFFSALWITLRSAEQVMHPPSPILTSDSTAIRLFFFFMVALCLLAGWQFSLWLHRRVFAGE
jgi:hypothetical protein